MAFGATTKIAFITDGPVIDIEGGASPLETLIKNELHELTTGKSNVSFVDPEEYVGDWTRESVEALVAKALNDKKVDMVIANGIIASRVVIGYESLPKPVFISFLIEPSPDFVQSTGKGSGVKNLYYANLGSTFADDARIFKEIVPHKELTVLCGPSVRANGSMAEDFVKTAGSDGTRVKLKVIENTMESIDRLVLDSEAVLVLPMPQLSRIKMISLITKINERKIPSFAYVRGQYVEDGLMATYLPEHFIERIGRRTALNIRKVIEGEKPENLTTELEFERRVILNVGTAKMIGVAPSWSVMADATLINEDQVIDGTDILSLESAVKESLMANLKLLAQDKYTHAAHEELRLARSALRPKLYVGVQQNNFDADRAQAGAHKEHEVSGTSTFSTLLLSEQARSGITVAQNLHKASLYELDDLRLEIALRTAVSYLNLLKYVASENIRKEDLRLTAASLKRAKEMVAAGASRKNEEYRWESQLASSKSALYSSKAVVAQEKLFLNSLLNRELTQEFATAGADIKDVFIHGVDQELEKHINNSLAMARFSDYMVETAYDKSPLLKAISKNIDAQRRIYMAAKRSYHVPDISIYGGLNDVWSSSGEGGSGLIASSQDDLEWNGGIRLDIPLTTGGERDAEKRRAARVLEQLTFEYDQRKLDVALQVRQSLEAIRATRPIIELAKQSAEAASKNYELVNDAYNAGAISIIILIDAQAKKLVADQDAVSARYNHLIQVLETQRYAGFFTCLMSDAEYNRWLTGAKEWTKSK
jgi:outer membrane protein TolC